MAEPVNTSTKNRTLLAVIGDEDSITGLLLAGVGHINENQKKNFLVVDASKETQVSTIEAAFQEFTERKDVAILLINQHIAEKIRPTVDRYQQAFPALLEIPSKDHPYDPSKDSVLKRVQKLFGE
ncbi:V-type proton ATPase subunit F [Mycena sanguinolenta]|uniref:V-type proton ATPase subunit F n=1 Tax=Mycena sanguinolenta TaxID=230812 RepID=A0A8H6XE76_9AGAR|nr:V-type proton ATPase subunit F [Mycena sanguinolenta]